MQQTSWLRAILLALRVGAVLCVKPKCFSDEDADNAFINAVREGPAAGCESGGFQRIDRLARLLSKAARAGCNSFGFHGQYGVFSSPPTPTNRSSAFLRMQAKHYTYGPTKATFLYNETCRHFVSGGGKQQLCEIGFNAGHTSLIWLEAAPSARVIAFDLGDLAYARKQAALMSRAYGERFQVVWGSSLETVPAHERKLSSKCDVAFLDGGKNRNLRLGDLRAFHRLSGPGTLLLFDEVTTLSCVRGVGVSAHQACGGPARTWSSTTHAYYIASRQGLISVDRCDWPPHLKDVDGVCSAHYRYNSTQYA